MGGIWMTGGELVGSVAEITGYKTGLALTASELRTVVGSSPAFAGLWPPSFDQAIRIRSENYEALIAWVLFKVGNIESPSTAPHTISLRRKYTKAGLAAEYASAIQIYIDFLAKAVQEHITSGDPPGAKIDPTPLTKALEEKHGPLGLQMALDFLDGNTADRHRSPWGSFRQLEWQDLIELRSLFEDEGLVTAYGEFFDQRFIDYLHRNFGDIDNMNWRKFEALAAEYFTREGHEVELGPGRGDEGVDVRVWRAGTPEGTAPMILVQCNRQKEKISKVVVKALYADVVHERAELGLIVTTSTLSLGAAKTCRARAYPIAGADRNTLAEWLSLMRTPGIGVFLAE